MKAITVHQPWATLLGIGAKEYETRGWGTSYRGPIAIHAGKNTDELIDITERLEALREHKAVLTRAHDPLTYYSQKLAIETPVLAHLERRTFANVYPLGVIVAVGTLARCCEMTPIIIDSITDQERELGYWRPGRFAWQIADVQWLREPIAARGQQGLWHVPDYVQEKIKLVLEAA